MGAFSKDDEKSSKNPSSVKSHWGQYWSTVSTNRSNDPGSRRSITAVWVIRILLVLVMITLCALLGFLAFKLLSDQELRLARTQFESISARAIVQAKDDLISRKWAGVTLANVVAALYPNADQWPYVEWQGFEEVTNNMLLTSQGEDMGFVPFVDPANLAQFENFTQGVYEKIGLPIDTAVKDWGFGVWARNSSVDPVEVYHDTTADTPYGSPYTILAPIMRTDEGFHPVLLFNVHSQAFTGNAIDSILACSERRKGKFQDQVAAEKEQFVDKFPSMPPNQCGAFTDIFNNNKLGGRWTVGNFNPIYPKNDPLDVVGYIPAMTPLDNLLENMFPPQVTGINAIFETDTRTITFNIVNGHAILVGEGRSIDERYLYQQRQVQLADPIEFFSTDDGSNVTKTLLFSLVPNDEFYQIYRSPGPAIAAVVVVCSILLTILVFLLYDFYVRREFNAKKELLEARRQFMRFVSHEVRTPLNAVSMGLDLMQSEVAQALGFDSPTTLRSSYDMVDDGAFESSERTNWSDADINQTIGGGTDQPAGAQPTESTLGGPSFGGTSSNQMKKVDSASTLESMADIKISPLLAKSWFQLSQEIQSNAQGAVDILNDLLNYDKIEQGTLNLSLEVLPIWELIEKAVMEFKVPASSKKVGLSVGFGEETRTTPRAQYLPTRIQRLKVVGDPVRLLQVVRNLMSNALKFTPCGGSIHVQAICIPNEKEDVIPEEHFEIQEDQLVTGYNRGVLQLRVVDTGAGMSQGQVDNLFQEGVQFNANELQAGGGSGLGLFIAQGIVTQHGGNLSASSEGLGNGTTFEMSVPLWEMTSTGGEAEYDVETGLPVSGDQGSTVTITNQSLLLPKSKLRVLVVDDVKSNRKLLRRLLENKGHECEEAVNGRECVDLVRKAAEEEMPYDSILLDYEMPGMDGPSAAKEIRCTLLDDDTNIVGVTGNVLPEDINYFRKCGANEVLSKPVNIGELCALWERHCILLSPTNADSKEQQEFAA